MKLRSSWESSVGPPNSDWMLLDLTIELLRELLALDPDDTQLDLYGLLSTYLYVWRA